MIFLDFYGVLELRQIHNNLLCRHCNCILCNYIFNFLTFILVELPLLAEHDVHALEHPSLLRALPKYLIRFHIDNMKSKKTIIF